MHATIRRYEGVDAARTNEVVSNVNETLVPQLRELPGFSGYYLIDAGNGVMSSISLFETPEQAEESDEARREVDHRREPQHGDSQRPEDHERQGRCSQRPHGRRRLARAYFAPRRGPGRAGPSSAVPLAWASVRECPPERANGQALMRATVITRGTTVMRS